MSTPQKHARKFVKMCEKQGLEFIRYDETGEWVFKAHHFTKYLQGGDEEDKEEEEDDQIDNEQHGEERKENMHMEEELKVRELFLPIVSDRIQGW